MVTSIHECHHPVAHPAARVAELVSVTIDRVTL